jgi:nuclear pore complex protein Nup98-Nup96
MHNHLFMSYAAQLESEGLWTWSVYVLLHLPSSSSTSSSALRDSAIKEILGRHSHSIEPEQEIFLVEKLRIPTDWIDQAKVRRE